MILTEEQKRALKRVVAYMDEMYAIASPYHGCTEDANILRAMIDSSEHFTDASKMIGFDLEKARAEVSTASARRFSESREQARIFCAEEILPDALDEIERLRGFETAARDLNNDLTRIAGERDDLAAQIQELEDVHKRSGVKYAKIINELRSSVYANIPGLKKQWDEILNTPANGKIGPDARPKCDHAWQAAIEEREYQTCLKCGECRNIEDIPRTAPAWQITEERKAAIKELSELLTAIGCPSCHYYIQKNYGENITVLRAMLTEADHDKP